MSRGWIIVTVAFVANFVAMGTVLQPVPVLLLPFVEEFGVGRAWAVLPSAATLAGGMVIMPFVGRLMATVPIRRMMIAGALSLSFAFYAMSLATEFWQILALFSLPCGFGLGALGVVATNTLVVNWFEEQRGLALGVAMMGMSLAGVVMLPLSGWVLEASGWRGVCRMLASIDLAVVPLLALTIVTRPSDVGLRPDGATDARDEGPALLAQEEDGSIASTREIVTNPSLWLLAAACGLVFFGSMGIMNNGIAFAVDRGIDPLRASVIVAAMALGAGAGKLVFGWLGGRFGEPVAFAIALGLQVVTLAGYLVFASYEILLVISLVYGLGLGGISPLQVALLARVVGARSFAPAQGLIGPIQIPFQIAGPSLAGFIADTRGSYDLAIVIFIAAMLVSALAMGAMTLRENRSTALADEPATA
ncbi:MAG: MFS transporter [bacterium]|nr:MFS transporter [bacterium]